MSDRRYRFIVPRIYRYRVADDVTGFVGVNRYPGEKPIGAQVRIGRFAYCIRWARTRAKTTLEHIADEVNRP